MICVLFGSKILLILLGIRRGGWLLRLLVAPGDVAQQLQEAASMSGLLITITGFARVVRLLVASLVVLALVVLPVAAMPREQSETPTQVVTDTPTILVVVTDTPVATSTPVPVDVASEQRDLAAYSFAWQVFVGAASLLLLAVLVLRGR